LEHGSCVTSDRRGAIVLQGAGLRAGDGQSQLSVGGHADAAAAHLVAVRAEPIVISEPV